MRWVWLGLLVLVMAVMPATAQETKLDESKMLIVAYYQAPVSLKGTIDMEKVYKAFDKIEYADPNGKYIDGIIYKDYPKDGIPIHVRVKSDGWIIAWVENKYDFYAVIRGSSSGWSGNALAWAIQKVCRYGELKFSVDGVKYYIPKYPDAKRLVIVYSPREVTMPSQCNFKLVKIYKFGGSLKINGEKVEPTTVAKYGWQIYDILRFLNRDTKYEISYCNPSGSCSPFLVAIW